MKALTTAKLFLRLKRSVEKPIALDISKPKIKTQYLLKHKQKTQKFSFTNKTPRRFFKKHPANLLKGID